jgi:hypothetical protein
VTNAVTAENAATALLEVSQAIDELKGRLEKAAHSVLQATNVNATELEMGKLFVRAQEFVDRAMRDAQLKATRIVAEARVTAGAIVEDARSQAKAIVEQANTIGISSDALRLLERTIDSFTRANSELSHELAELNSALNAQPTEAAPTEWEPSVPQAPPPPPYLGEEPVHSLLHERIRQYQTSEQHSPPQPSSETRDRTNGAYESFTEDEGPSPAMRQYLALRAPPHRTNERHQGLNVAKG